MKVILQVLNGRLVGNRFSIQRGERLTVGSSDAADLHVPGDSRMAAIHFEMECLSETAKITCLSRRDRLLVNGRPVPIRTLADNDTVEAGGTRFQIRLVTRGESPAPERPADEPESVHPADNTSHYTSVVRPEADSRFPYTRHKMASGLIRFSGQRTKFTELDVARFVQREFGMYLVVHGGTSGEAIGESVNLESVAPRPVEATGSRLVTPQCAVDRWNLLQCAWNHNSISGLFSAREPGRMVELVHQCGFLTLPPQHLRYQLERSQTAAVHACFRGLAAILIELDLDRWGLYVSPRHLADWERLGLPKAPVPSSQQDSGSDSAWSSFSA
ncbi:MAG: FHA domain-containing protein [Planctomycetota bacterium]|nr:FHA domain-containing protein [Planctomycetota bacterium]